MSSISTYLGCIRFPHDDFVCYIVVHASEVVEHINFIPVGSPLLTGLQSKPLQKSVWGQPFLDLLNGKQVNIPHKFPEKSPFLNSAYKCLYSIPYGDTVTYRQLAIMAGYPKAPRAVGLAMKNNPLPLIYPCHRVIGTDGKLHGFCGKGEEYIAIKKTLLYAEKYTELKFVYC